MSMMLHSTSSDYVSCLYSLCVAAAVALCAQVHVGKADGPQARQSVVWAADDQRQSRAPPDDVLCYFGTSFATALVALQTSWHLHWYAPNPFMAIVWRCIGDAFSAVRNGSRNHHEEGKISTKTRFRLDQPRYPGRQRKKGGGEERGKSHKAVAC